jgi:NAD(P)-dependent dehydrogenase (short-subunit alcohol dehydrogenase family)
MEVKGTVAVVTGGASGLGEATARHLHGLGARVLIFDRDEGRAKEIAGDLGDGASFVAGDAASEADAQDAVHAAVALGPLRVLVACAGGARKSERLLHRDGTPHDLAHFTDTIQLNVTTTFNCVRLAAAAMAAQDPVDQDGTRGAIVTTASIAGYEGQIGQIAYGSAKAAIIGMTVIAARDLAAAGIRVNCIAPGTIGTRAWEGAPDDLRRGLEEKVPFPRRFGRPDEFASLVAHLVGNDYINGHVVRLDGAIRFDPK